MSLDHGPQHAPPEGDIELIGLKPPLSPRSRARRLAVSVAVVVLALAVILGTIPGVRQRVVTLLTGPVPTSTPVIMPGADSVYFTPSPPGVTVLVDGRPLRSVPLAYTNAQPLRLARGIHQLEWHGAPFASLRCRIAVPVPFIYTPIGSDACPIQTFPGRPPGYVVTERESLATLPPVQQAALQSAIEASVRNADASNVIQPGEPYLGPPQTSPYSINTAAAPLRATLSFSLALDSGWSEPCVVMPTQPCRFPNQDCRQVCNTPLSGSNQLSWLAAVPVHATWEFTALDGAPVSQEPAALGPNFLLALLSITWDGTTWHVAPVFGHSAGSANADDIVCAPARDWLAAQGPSMPIPLVPVGPLLLGATGGPDDVTYISGPDPLDGCFVSVPPSALASSPIPLLTQPATFLFRFGVLVAVNAAAHQAAPQLPVADAAERAIAQRLQSGAG